MKRSGHFSNLILIFIFSMGIISFCIKKSFASSKDGHFNHEYNCITRVENLIEIRTHVPSQGFVKQQQIDFLSLGESKLKNKVYALLKTIANTRKHFYMKLNKNPRPIYFIKDDLSYPKIMVYLRQFKPGKSRKNSDQKEADKIVNGWFTSYKQYKENEADLSLEYVTNNYLITVLSNYKKNVNLGPSFSTEYIKGQINHFLSQFPRLKKRVHFKLEKKVEDENLIFPFTLEFDLYINKDLKRLKDSIEDFDEVDEYLYMLKARNIKIQGSLLSGPGLIDKLQFNQVLNHKRLEYLRKDLKDVILNYPHPHVPEKFLTYYKELKDYLDDESFKPNVKFFYQIQAKQLKSESEQLFINVVDIQKKFSNKAVAIINTLTEEEKQKLELNSIGRFATYLKHGKTILIISSVLSGGAGTYSFWEWINAGEEEKLACLESEEEFDFMYCLGEYIKNKYPILKYEKAKNKDYHIFDFKNNKNMSNEEINAFNETNSITAKWSEKNREISDDKSITQDIFFVIEKGLSVGAH